jgi:hypothetical protein
MHMYAIGWQMFPEPLKQQPQTPKDQRVLMNLTV